MSLVSCPCAIAGRGSPWGKPLHLASGIPKLPSRAQHWRRRAPRAQPVAAEATPTGEGTLHFAAAPEGGQQESLVEERGTTHFQAGFSGRAEGSHAERAHVAVAALPLTPPPAPPGRGNLLNGRDYRFLLLGGILAVVANVFLAWASHLPLWQRIVRRFIWWGSKAPPVDPYGAYSGQADNQTTAMVLYSDTAETVEWINMCWRKMWRVYQRGLERWLADLLQPVFDNLVAEKAVPHFVQRLRILEFSLDHEAPYFSNMRRRQSRKDSDLNGVVDVRYTGGARMLLLLVVGQGRWRVKIPVLVSDLDLESRMWIKVRLAPMCPFVGTISLAFVGPPNIKVQLLPYNRVRLMRIPILQAFLTKLLTIDLPGLMVLPKRLEINIPPAVTAVAEAAVGRDAVMRAVASAVLQADALEVALMAALPLGPQSAAGGVTLPVNFNGELSVTLKEARNLAVWGFPWQSNPYCRVTLGSQAVRGRRDDQTSHAGSHRAPVWNQEFQFLVEDPRTQVLTISIRDSHITGRPDVGYIKFPLSQMPLDGMMDAWLPVQAPFTGEKGQGELHLQLVYKPFEDDEEDDMGPYNDMQDYARNVEQPFITDVKSAADASAKANLAASAAAAAVAVTKAAAARAAAKAARRQLAARTAARRQAREDEMEAKLLEAAKFDSDGSSIPGSPSSNGASILSSSDESGDNREAAGQNAAGRRHTNGTGVVYPGNGADASKEALRSLAESVDFQPEDLFPGWEFRVSEGYDEDMPYPFREGGKKKRRRPRPAPDQNGAAFGERNGAAKDGSPAVSADAELAFAGEGMAGGNGAMPVMVDVEGVAAPLATATAEGRAADVKERPSPAAVGVATTLQTRDDDEDVVNVEAIALPAGSMNPLTKQVGMHTRDPDKIRHRLQDEAMKYYGHADESIRDMITADAEADRERAERGIGGWWGATKDAVGNWVGGAVGGVAKWWEERNNQFGEDPLDKKRRKEEERREQDRREGREPLEDLVVPPDLPIEAIAEEVKDAWRLKEVHVESLLKKAVEKSERPWLMFLGTMTIICVVMLALVFWRLESLM